MLVYLYSGSSNGLNNYYLGFSLYHINKPNLSFIDKTWALASRMTVHAGGSFPMSDDAYSKHISYITSYKTRQVKLYLVVPFLLCLMEMILIQHLFISVHG